jgi:hypothetical protein
MDDAADTWPGAAGSGKRVGGGAGLAAKLLKSISGPHLAPQPMDVKFSSHDLTPPIAICSTVYAGTGQPLDSSWNARSEAKPPAYPDSTARWSKGPSVGPYRTKRRPELIRDMATAPPKQRQGPARRPGSDLMRGARRAGAAAS